MTNKIPKGNDRVALPDIFVTEYDLQEEDLALCLECLGLEKTLYGLGFDVELGFEKLYNERRTRWGNKIVEGYWYSGKERTDQEWLDSGMASADAKDAARKDMSYLREIRNLSKRSR